MKRLAHDIEALRKEIASMAKGYGLDFFEVVFELIDPAHLNEIAAYGGFPTRYPHWRFGMDFDHLTKGYDYGFQKIYELVINNDPCYAYLMNTNTLLDQKMVMAHVYAHADFFKNNFCFKQTHRKMMDEMANHACRVRSFQEQWGEEEVESFIDVCLSLENLISIYEPYGGKSTQPKFPVRDILGFLAVHAPLPDWQRDLLSLIRQEAYYFAPQLQTKIMNEGWASYWHSKILTEKALKEKEIIDFADHHAAALSMRPGQMNPYKIGIEIFRDIEDRWNRGKFGPEYEACEDDEVKQDWNQQLGLGMKKIFEVRKNYNDITFIDEFLTSQVCERLQLYVYGYNKRNGTYEILDRDCNKVKQKLLNSLTNFGSPLMEIREVDFEACGGLLLYHHHEGVDLKISEAKETLERLEKIWKKTVYVQTVLNGERRLLLYDGHEHKERSA